MADIPQMTEQQVAPGEPQGGEMNPNVSTAQTGGTIAQGVQKLGSDVSSEAMQWKQKIDGMTAMNASTDLGSKMNELLLNVRSTSGAAAAPAYQKAQQELQDYHDQTMKNLGDFSQKSQVEAEWRGINQHFQNYAGEHVGTQTRIADREALTNIMGMRMTTTYGAITSNGVNDKTLASAAAGLKAGYDDIDQHGARNNDTPDDIALQKQHFAGAYVDKTTEAMLEVHDTAAAAAFYHAHADSMTTEAQQALGRKIDAAVKTQTINDKVDAAIEADRQSAIDAYQKTYGGIVPSGNSLDAKPVTPPPPGAIDTLPNGNNVFAALASDKDLAKSPEDQDRAFKVAEGRIRTATIAQNQADDATARSIRAEIFSVNGDISANPALSAKIQGAPARIQDGLRKYADDLQNPPESDPKVYIQVQDMMVNHPDKFRDQTSTQLHSMVATHLDRKDQLYFAGKWGEMQGQKNNGSILSKDSAVTLTFEAMKPVGGDTKEWAQRRLDASLALDQWSQAETKRTGKAPSSTELSDHLMKTLIQQNNRRRVNPDAPTDDDLATPAARAAWSDAYAAKQPPLQQAVDHETIPDAHTADEYAQAQRISLTSLPILARQHAQTVWNQAQAAKKGGNDQAALSALDELDRILSNYQSLPPHANHR